MLRRLFTTLLLLARTVCVCLAADSHAPRHETHYDWSLMAESLTRNCDSDYDKAYAIYHWICRNIAYDTDREIRDADRCYDERKGVCQAYCEMYYYIADAAGLNVAYVSGKSKSTRTGEVSDKGHAWVSVITGDGQAILMDPTWGAGYVSDDNVFTHRKDDTKWFDVDPRVMICTHLPKDSEYQFLVEPLSEEEFCMADFKTPDMSLECVGVKLVPVEEIVADEVVKWENKEEDDDSSLWQVLLSVCGGLIYGVVEIYRDKA